MSRPIAVVTGGNTGIGKAISEVLTEVGYQVGIFYASDESGAHALANVLGGRAFYADLSDEQSVQMAMEQLQQELGPVQLLVNNAGVQERVAFADMTTKQFDHMIAVNTRGVFLMMKAVIPSMMTARSGKIINIASQTALIGRSEMVHYTASKGAVIAMTKSLAREMAEYGILVNCIAPGPVTSGPALSNEDERSKYKKTIPLKRFATPKEVAETVKFLTVSGNYYTGQVLSPNGGEVM